MAKDLSQNRWHGIERKEIPWFPSAGDFLFGALVRRFLVDDLENLVLALGLPHQIAGGERNRKRWADHGAGGTAHHAVVR